MTTQNTRTKGTPDTTKIQQDLTYNSNITGFVTKFQHSLTFQKLHEVKDS